jgi:hypothetical protein
MSSPQRFQIGDKVWWESQAGGFRTTKHGTIVQIVAGDKRPDFERFPSLRDSGWQRGHDSYVVEVLDPPRQPKYYWPRARALFLSPS